MRVRHILLFLLLLSWGGTVFGQPWLSGQWRYRQSVAIANPASQLLTDYQVRLLLHRSNIDFSACAKNGQDVRVTAGDGTTLLPHWIEVWSPAGDSAVVWVKVPRIVATDTTMLFLYFGNTAAGNASNGTATFDFFEDFEAAHDIGTGWTPKRSLPFERVADCTGAVYKDKLYVFGGYDRNAPADCNLIFSDQVAMYDPATDTWARKAPMPTPRWGAIAVECDGLIHVFCGNTQAPTTGAVHEVYDPATDKWSAKPPGPRGVNAQGAMGVLVNNKIHLFLSKGHYEYDPVAETYTERAPVPTPRKWATCATVNGLIYLIGGAAPGFPGGYTNVNEVYDPRTDQWTSKAPLPVSRYGVTRENPVINGKIYVSHGQSAGFFTDVFCYDPTTDKWEKRSSGINPRDGVACGVINNKLYVVGGRATYDCVIGMNQLEEYDPAKDKLVAPDPWICDNAAIIRRDTSAHFQGDWGLLFDKLAMVGELGIQTPLKTPSCAVDFYWKVTSTYATTADHPWGVMSLTQHLSDGSMIFSGAGAQPHFTWFDGNETFLQNASLDQWYPVTVAWSGATSTVLIGSKSFNVSTAVANTSRVYFGVNYRTRQYIDLVRVRKFTSPVPIVTLPARPAQVRNVP